MGWRTVITFVYPHEAHMAASYLGSFDIQTFIRDELTAQVDNFYSNAIGGVKVQVMDDEVESALKLLKEGGYIVEDPETNAVPDIELIAKTENTSVCPFCQSQNFSRYRQTNYLTLAVFVALGVFFPIFRSSYVCYDCGKHWKYK